MKTNIIRLGTNVKDRATGLTGTLTHAFFGADLAKSYCFQPLGMDNDTKKPLTAFWLPEVRLTPVDKNRQDIDLPLEIVLTPVKHERSGYCGTVVGITLHINGCIHADVQAHGSLKSGQRIEAHDFSVLELTGPAIKKLSQKEEDKSRAETPSPSPAPARPRG